ncbi:MAG: hypothetical protein EBS72_09655, partial [Rhizobiales bacterium]|nr:hypothetical protein [Hyphomicrobiales bacterium]
FDLGGFDITVGSLAGTGGTVSLGSKTLTAGGNNANTTYAGSLTGTGGLTTVGGGELTLSGTNTFSGALSVSNHGLVLGSSTALSGGNAVTLSNGTTLLLQGHATTIASLASSDINSGVDLGGATLTMTTVDGQSVTFDGAVVGPGSLVVGNGTATGTWVTTTRNPLVGTVTIASGATLEMGDNSNIQGILRPTSMVVNGTLVFNRTAGTALTSAVSGSGLISQIGSGSTTLSGNNSTFAGTVRVAAGTLQMGSAASLSATTTLEVNGGTFDLGGFDITAGSLAGTGGTVALGSKTLTEGGNNTTTSFAGAVTGTGGITKVGTGTTTLAGTNTFSGAATVSAGILILSGANDSVSSASIASGATLQIGAGGTSGSLATASITDNGTLTFNRSDSIAYSTVISGTGGLSHTGTGTTTLSGNNTYSGTVNVIAGTLILTGSNSTTATATIANGATLQLGNGGTTGSLASTSIVDNGTLVFNRSDTVFYSTVISGAGGLSHNGTGTTTLSGTNTFSGTVDVTAGILILTGSNSTTATTTIANGATLQIGNGGTTGSLSSIIIVNNGTLIFNRSDSFTVPASISGTGGLTQSGTGTTTLTGTNSFTGQTQVLAGELKTGAPEVAQSTSDYGSLTFAQLTKTKSSLPVAPFDTVIICDFGGNGSSKSGKRGC